MPDLPKRPTPLAAAGADARRQLAERVHALVCGQGFQPKWIVAEVLPDGWEVTLEVEPGGRRWRLGAAAGRPFRIRELTSAGEIPLRHPPLADRTPASGWTCASRLLAASLRDPLFRGFDCPVI